MFYVKFQEVKMYNSIFYLLYLAAKNGYKTIFGQNLSAEQLFLEKITGKKFPHEKAEYLFERISDHKWYIGEKLKRDVGFRVAAIDFLENYAETEADFNNSCKGKYKKSGIYAGLSSFA